MALTPITNFCAFSLVLKCFIVTTLNSFYYSSIPPIRLIHSKTKSGIIHIGLSFNAHISRGSSAKSSGDIARGTRPAGEANVIIAIYSHLIYIGIWEI